MKSEHTPTPWESEPNHTGVFGADGSLVVYGHRIEDTEFIVRACNSHDDLLAACESAETFISDWRDRADVEMVPVALTLLRAAISKAKGT